MKEEKKFSSFFICILCKNTASYVRNIYFFKTYFYNKINKGHEEDRMKGYKFVEIIGIIIIACIVTFLF